ncbi:sensor histidine kinase [Xylanimonas ulmi]|uniref:histidine kinase n=2 Tax=Xylanimonas ulmi TaxID=228973 RepID=A0A4Q7M8B1_9MICO|nr:sensor kinase SpoOB-type protein [Xylanibacterium ulmi]
MVRATSLRVQLLLLQVAIVLALICTTGVVASWVQERQLRGAYLDRMTGVAQSVARLPSVVDALDDADPSATIQPIAEVIRRASDVTYVVVADTDGIRHSHPDPTRIGERVSTDPAPALAGQVWTGTQTGTLGTSWRVKVPIYGTADDDAASAPVVGVASVGILESELRRDLRAGLGPLFGALAASAAVGVVAAVWVTQLVRRRFFRLEPAQVQALMRDLDGARGLTAALRAQAHEFANTLHVVSGLLDLGRGEDAMRLIERETRDQTAPAPPVPPGVRAPEIAAVLRVKARIAAAHGIALVVDESSDVSGLGDDPTPHDADHYADLLTVLGNLVENAAEAVGPGGHVSVRVTDTAVVVDDDGPGIPRGARREVFEDGVSTKPPTPERPARGVGLALVRRATDRWGGRVIITTSPLRGARVAVTLPWRPPPAPPAQTPAQTPAPSSAARAARARAADR